MIEKKFGLYPINPDRTIPWNDLPQLPIDEALHRNVPVLEKLLEAKTALARLYGRSVAVNQKMLIDTISLQEAKESSQV